MTGSDVRPRVAMLLYPGVTLMDLLGPHTAWWQNLDVMVGACDTDAVTSDSGLVVHPTHTFADVPADLDVLFVPGGVRIGEVLRDGVTLAFLADRGARARWVTSVCVGSIILGAAGLLDGYRAGCHWTALSLLSRFGATPTAERVVVDRNRVTGGGITAGLDFGLTLLAMLADEDTARLVQLGLEYAPAPPFDSGSPDTAAPRLVARVQHACESDIEEIEEALTQQDVSPGETSSVHARRHTP